MDPSQSGPGFSVAIAGPPFSPRLRFAHRWQRAARAAGGDGEVALRQLADWEIFYQLTGRTWIVVPAAGGCLELPPDHLALIPPGLVHGWRSERGAHLAVHGDLHAQPQLSAAQMVRFLDRRHPCGSPIPSWDWQLRIGAQTHDLALILRAPDAVRWRRELTLLVEAHLGSSCRHPIPALQADSRFGSLLAEALHVASQQPEDPLLGVLASAAQRPVAQVSIPGLAAQLGLGETAFRQRVHHRTGSAPRIAIERLRLERAAYALRNSDEPIATIATTVGFDDPFHFSRAFRRHYGCSPSEWRKVDLFHLRGAAP